MKLDDMLPEMLLVKAASVASVASLLSIVVAGRTLVNVNPIAVGGFNAEGARGSDVKVGLLEVAKEMPVCPSVPVTVPANAVLLKKLVGPFVIVKVPTNAS